MKLNFYLPDDIREICGSLSGLIENFEDKTILISGAKGFLGRYFMGTFSFLNKNFLKKPCKVIGIDNLITAGKFGQYNFEDVHFKFHEHNIINPIKIEGKVDYILHAAGIASPYYYRAFPLETMDVSVSGTKNMLELAREKNAKLAFFSSSEIYGDPLPQFVPTKESYRGNVSCLGHRACYDESKRLGETMCQVYHKKFGVNVNMIRPFNVYGPGMQENDYRVLPNFAARIRANKPLDIYGKGSQTRTFCYVTDAIAGFLRVLVSGVPGEPYNVGNPSPEISMLDLVKTIEKILKTKLQVNIGEYPDSYPADEPLRRCPDITKIQAQLGYEPKVGLEAGLARFLSWAGEIYTGVQ